MSDFANKSSRVLFIYEQLITGHIVRKDDIATRFNVSSRTVQRDIDEVKEFCANGICWNQSYRFVVYDHIKKGICLLATVCKRKDHPNMERNKGHPNNIGCLQLVA